MSTNRASAALCCSLAGVALAFSVPPWGWWPLAFVGVAALDAAIASVSGRARFRRGLLVGVIWLGISTIWMWDLTPPGYIVATLVYGTLLGAAMAATPPGRGRWVGLVGSLVLFEAIRWTIPFGGVPLSTLAMSQADAPLGQTVRSFGPLLLAALVVVAGIGLGAARQRAYGVTASASAILLGALALTALSPSAAAIGEISVAIVQGGGPQGTRAIDTDEREVFERHLEASALVGDVDLVLWPENVVNVAGRFVDSPEHDELASLARRLDAILVPGVVEDGEPGEFLNFAVAYTADGDIVDRYDKVKRVPFGEYVPLRALIEPFAPNYLPSKEAVVGTGEATLDTPLGRFGVVISWEVFFDTRARDAIGNGGQLLLNPTNGSSYWLTIVQSQQIASSRLRAMETDRWVLQAAPTGFSAIVTPDGDVIDRTAVSEQAVVEGTVELRTGTTWAVRFGRWPMLAVAVVALTLGWRRERGWSRSGVRSRGSGSPGRR